MKKRNGIKIVGISVLLVLVMIVGVILSWDNIWASNQIQSYTIKLSAEIEEIKGVEIMATNSSGETETAPIDEEGNAVFKNALEKGETYTITVNLDQKYYVKRAQIKEEESEESEEPPVSVKIGKENSYSLKVKVDEGQLIELDLRKKEKEKLSNRDFAELPEKGRVDSDKEEVFIYDKKTDTVKVKMKNKDVTEVGYKASGEDVKLFDGSSFEIKKTTEIEELYIKGNESEEWTVYQLSPVATIVIDIDPPVVTVKDDDYKKEYGKDYICKKNDENGEIVIEIYTQDKETKKKLKFEVKNEKLGSNIEGVYFYNEDESKEEAVSLQEGVYEGTIKIETEDETKPTVYVLYARDEAENQSKKITINVYYDETPPEVKSLRMTTEKGAEIAYDKNGTKSWKTITLEVEVEDTASGIDTITLVTNKGEREEKDIKDGKVSFTFEEDDEIKNIICTDRVGNDNKLKPESDFLILCKKVNDTIKSQKVCVGSTEVAVTPEIIDLTGFGENDLIYTVKSGDGTKDNPTMIAIASDEKKELKIKVEETKKQMGIESIQIKKEGEDTPLRSFEYSEHSSINEGQLSLRELNLKAKDNEITDNKFEIVVTMAGEQEITSHLVIRVDKKCPEIESIQIRDAATGDSLSETGFGKIFTNKAVKVIVTAKDDSDIKSITLYNEKGEDQQLIESKPVKGNTGDLSFTAEFTIQAKEGQNIKYSLAATAVDRVGNECAKPDRADARPFTIDTIKPTCEITVPPAIYGGVWYAGDVKFSVKVQDDESGLKKVTAKLNGNKIREIESNYAKNETHKDNDSVSTKEAERAKDGSYTLEVTVTDNAGNTRTTARKIFVDTKNPEIVSFEFEAAGYSEGKKTDFGVDKRDYGYYFKEKTKVTIRAKDAAPSSGLQSISYYTVDKDGGKSEVKTEEVSLNGSITFYIPANFKGQIYAKPTDHVNHSPEEYVTPDSAVIENADRHKKDSAITITRAKTSKKDAKRKPLYKKNVVVTVKVSDRYSGIRKVEYSVTAPYDTGKNQKGTIEIDNNGEKKQGSATGWERTGKEKNLVTELTGKLTVSNNSNDIVVKIKMTDRAGHTSTKQDTFGIDKTNPVIRISYDNNKEDKKFPGYYKKKRTATIVVTERNFNAKLVKYKATNKDGETPLVDLTEAGSWKKKVNKKNPDQTTYTAKIPFTEDGKYTWDLSLKDRAGNAAGKVKTQKFTIDQTDPLITVTYDNEDQKNEYYYKKDRLATITIEEHNFEESRIKISGKSQNDGKAVAFPPVSAWLHDGDTHIATILYSQDAEYFFQITYSDQAGNEAISPPEDHFFVDKTLPEISITGVENESANQGKVIPVVTYTDVNLDAATLDLSLRGANRDKVETQGEAQEIKNGYIFTFYDFENKKEMDDIYTLVVSVEDMAGNKSPEQTISFSVNRFGSTYRFELEPLTSVVSETQKGNCRYIQNEFDIELKEINVDELNKETPRIRMLKNGSSMELKEGTDYTVKHEGGGKKWSKKTWSEYTYVIGSSNFSTDGMYEVEVTSRDDAGNKNENMDKEKKASIQFAIDKTEPVIIPIDIEKDTQYPLDQKEVKVAVKDNMITPDVKIYLNEREVQYKTEGEDCILTVPSASVKQNLKIVANDAAGNNKTVVVEDFLVSTSLFVRWYNNLPLFAGTLAGFGMLLVLIIVLVIVRKMKRKEAH